MGNSLTGLTPSTTYDALIKTGDNGPITSTPKTLSDGLGNDLPIQVSTTAVNFTNQLQQGGIAVPTASQVNAKQDTLVSGTSIKTINSTSLLGSGNVAVQETLISGTNIKTVNSTTILGSGDIAVQATLVSGTNIKTINGTSVLGSGNIVTPTTPPSGVAGAIQFSNGSAFASDASNLFWDDTNNRLGIGTSSPTELLTVGSSGKIGLLSPAFGQTTTIDVNGYQGLNILTGPNSTQGIIINGYGSGPNSLSATNSTSNTIRNYVITYRGGSGKGVLIDPISTSVGESTASLQIKGSGSTSATTSLLVQNSATTRSLEVLDNATTIIGQPGYGVKIHQQTVDGLPMFAAISGDTATLPTTTNYGFYVSSNGNYSGLNAAQGIDLRLYGTTRLQVAFNTGNIIIQNAGSYTDIPSARLQVTSTTQGFLPPRMTTAQKNAIATPAAGLVVYDSTTNKLCCYNGSTWNDLF